MNYSDIQHRFANRLAGKNGCIKAGNVRYEGRNFYSYSTVFGQWLDTSKNVVAIFDGSTSPSSSKHKLWKGVFPDDVHVFPLDFGSNSYYGGWRNCNLVSKYLSKDEDFKEYHRMQMIDHYVGRIYDQLAAINGGKKKGLENVNFSAWGYIEELCSLYKDTSIAKYIKWAKNKDYKKLVKLLKDGERNVQVLTDALFGEGAFKKYWDYCARYRKADENKSKVVKLCSRLGIAQPYEKWCGYDVLRTELTADQIRKLTAKERIELHFKALAHKEYNAHESERKKLYNKRKDNAYRWIVGFEPVIESSYSHSHKPCEKVRNMYTGEVYEVGGKYISGFYWLNLVVSFNYNDFRNSEDKEKWIADFYAKCKDVADNRKAISILRWAKANTREKVHSYDDDIYILDEKLTDIGMDAESLAIVTEFIRKQDKHYADEEAQRRASEIERLRREEEERKEKEYMEQVKKEQIAECVQGGAEGCRNLWRNHLTDLFESERYFEHAASDGDFFYNGNVLLRLNLNKDTVETSKNIRIPVEVCKKMWKIVSKWHENPKCFKSMEIDTKGSGRYTISSYENDILTAGCHKIAFVEMERMYNEIIAAV